MANMKEKVLTVLERIKPSIQAHGGDVALVGVDEPTGVVKVKLKGACATCPMAMLTLQMGIEKELKREIPEVKKVVSVEQSGKEEDWQV